MASTAHDGRLIDRALIPAAGLGTRLRPLTAAIPKEMLPIGRKPVLEHVLEEVRAAGIRRVLFIVSPGKDVIARYFADGAAWDVECAYALQPEMRGLGDALLRGEEWTEGRPFVVAFGDCLVDGPPCADSGGPAPLRRLMTTHTETQAAATVLTECVPVERVSRYGILAPAARLPSPAAAPFPLAGIVEKPDAGAAPSRQAVAARWALDSRVFDYLRRLRPGPDGEIGLTDAVAAMLADGLPGWAVPLVGEEARRDIGGWETYLLAAARAACQDPEYGARIRRALGA